MQDWNALAARIGWPSDRPSLSRLGISRFCLDYAIECAGGYGRFVLQKLNEAYEEDVEKVRREFYPLGGMLAMFEAAKIQHGDSVATLVGRRLINHPLFGGIAPGGILHGLRVINKSYHLIHLLDGQLMYDFRTRAVTRGIGDYKVKHLGPGEALVTSDSAYPCAYDRAIITGFAERLTGTGRVLHEANGCRRGGSGSCTYRVRWNEP